MVLPKMTSPDHNNRWRIYLFLLLGGVAITLIGVWLGYMLNEGARQTQPLPGGRQLILKKIELGALRKQADPEARNPATKTKRVYSLQDQLVLRVTTTEGVTEPVELNARLLTPDGVIVELDPPTVTLDPGTSSFCCWQIEEAGEYSLQLFRPEKIVTSLPLLVQDIGQVSAPQF